MNGRLWLLLRDTSQSCTRMSHSPFQRRRMWAPINGTEQPHCALCLSCRHLSDCRYCVPCSAGSKQICQRGDYRCICRVHRSRHPIVCCFRGRRGGRMSLKGKGSRHCALHSTQRSWCRSSANSRGLGPQHTHRYSNTTPPLTSPKNFFKFWSTFTRLGRNRNCNRSSPIRLQGTWKGG